MRYANDRLRRHLRPSALVVLKHPTRYFLPSPRIVLMQLAQEYRLVPPRQRTKDGHAFAIPGMPWVAKDANVRDMGFVCRRCTPASTCTPEPCTFASSTTPAASSSTKTSQPDPKSSSAPSNPSATDWSSASNAYSPGTGSPTAAVSTTF